MAIGKILTNKKYSGFIWHLLFAGLFIGLSLLFLEFTEGVKWYLISAALRIIFCILLHYGCIGCRWDNWSYSRHLSYKNYSSTGFHRILWRNELQISSAWRAQVYQKWYCISFMTYLLIWPNLLSGIIIQSLIMQVLYLR